MHLVRPTQRRGEADAVNCMAAMPTPLASSSWRSLSRKIEPISGTPCRLFGTTASAPCTDRQLSVTRVRSCEEEARNEFTIETRMFLRPPGKEQPPTHSERLLSYRAVTTYAVSGHSLRLRPRRRTSCTLSPRAFLTAASTARVGSFSARKICHQPPCGARR